MANWSDWIKFDSSNVKKFTPKKPGIYRIRLSRDKVFKLEKLDNSIIWQGLYRLTTEKDKKKLEEMTTLTFRNTKKTLSNLVYIGKSVDQDIQKRLQQHLSGNGSLGLKRLMKYGVTMYVSFIQSSNPSKSELNFYKKYITDTNGHCPPSDCCSNECTSQEGLCTVGKLKRKGTNYTIC